METLAVVLSSTVALIALIALRDHYRQTEIPKLALMLPSAEV
jgi:hypothetical protein